MDHIRLIQCIYDGYQNPLDFVGNYQFSKLPIQSRYHLILLVALARRQNRYLPNDPIWLQNQIQSSQPVILGPYMGIWFESMKDVEMVYDGQGYLSSANSPKAGEKVLVKGLSKKEADGMSFDQVAGFEKAWEMYPAKIGRLSAQKSYHRSVNSFEDHARFMKALENYTTWIRALNAKAEPGKGRPWMDGKRFFNNWEADFENFTTPEETAGQGRETFQEEQTRKFLENKQP